MTSPGKRALAAAGFACLVSFTIACRHKAVTNSLPTTSSTPIQQASMQPDQVNTAGWDQAWTNLVNDAEQTFTPSLPRLTAVEVELVVGNRGAKEDQLTLTLLDTTGQNLAVVAQSVPVANADHVLFPFPKGGVEVSPGQTYRLRLSGGLTFGWKYVVGGYKYGEATFNGKPLLAQARSTFLFRTFGSQ
jgi:hypothetical protein